MTTQRSSATDAGRRLIAALAERDFSRLSAALTPDVRIKPGAHAAAAVDPQPGCRFVGRCPIAEDVCHSVTPLLVEARPAHSARCHVNAPAPEVLA